MGLKSSSWIWRASSMAIDHSLTCLLSTVLGKLKGFKAGNIKKNRTSCNWSFSQQIPKHESTAPTNMLQFQRYDQGRIFCDLVKVSLSHKKSEINDISKILACLSMQQFAIISWQLAKIISCKDISSKNYYFNIGKQLWIVISDNVWQYMKHIVLFVVFATWNFGVFKT